MKVVVTGGAGFVGSHLAVELCKNGHDVVIVDNLERSDFGVIDRISQIVGSPIAFEHVDSADLESMTRILNDGVDAVVHCAGLKSVEESVREPLLYYRSNLESTFGVLHAMENTGVNTIVFSSSATVYGLPDSLPVREASPTGQRLSNAYARTKYMIEVMLEDFARAHPDVRAIALRYFNPIGAHPSGLLGELPGSGSSNIMPKLLEVALGARDRLKVFGADFPSVDGTGVRDYIHVVDLAAGHIAALQSAQAGFRSFNLGTGHGTTVLQLVAAFERATGVRVDTEISPRREGDVAESYADATRALDELGWKATLDIDQACSDAWRWAQGAQDLKNSGITTVPSTHTQGDDA